MNVHNTFFIWARLCCLIGLVTVSLLACDNSVPDDPSCRQCNDGQEKCSADNKGLMICKKIVSTGCYQFVLKRCDAGLVCTRSTASNGRLICQRPTQTCTSSCTIGDKKCEGQSVSVCRNDSVSGCTQWFPETTCPAGQPCQNGACGGTTGCTPQNPQAKKGCVGNAVHWFDDCNQQGAQIETCSTPNVCSQGACTPPGSCTPQNLQAQKKCVGNAVHWFDDCGQQGAQIETCTGGCNSGACTTGCTPQDPKASKKCVGSALHWFDNCGNQKDLAEQCQNGCQNGACTGGCQASNLQAQKKCVGDTIYWFDNCGKQRALVETCSFPKSCVNAACVNQQCPGGGVCTAGARRCSSVGQGVEVCNQNATTNCYEWSAPLSCGSGQICSAGQCIQDPNNPGGGGSKQCKVGIGGTCSNDNECCSGQSCKSFAVIKACGPCKSDSDCPKDSIGLPTKCCSIPFVGSFCASVCPI